MEEVRVGWGELRRQRELVEAHCWRRRGSQAGAQGRRHGHRENDAGLTCRGAAATREPGGGGEQASQSVSMVKCQMSGQQRQSATATASVTVTVRAMTPATGRQLTVDG